MGERVINPILNIQSKYRKMIFINPYSFGVVDPYANVFLGTVSNLWDNTANWSLGHLPTSIETAIIRANCALNISPTVNKLVVETGRTLSSWSTTNVLNVNADCDVAGVLDYLGVLILKGTVNSIATYTSGKGEVRYGGSVNQTIIPLNYFRLSTAGTGTTKFLSADTTVDSDFGVVSKVECGIYSLTVLGITSMLSAPAILSKNSSTGSLLFIGQLNIDGVGGIDFSGNPNIELRGGLNYTDGSITANSGTGTWTFSTNNQDYSGNNMVYTSSKIKGNMIISGAITITIPTGKSAHVEGTITGDNAGSTFNNNGTLRVTNPIIPMSSLGVFNHNNFANSGIVYMVPGNFTLPYASYENLSIYTYGIKSLSANTTVNKSLVLSDALTLQCGSYNLIINGTTGVNYKSTFAKSAGGSLVFIGGLNLGGSKVSLTGNPTIEFRGGISNAGGYESVSDYGSGAISFTTNNQSFDNFYYDNGNAYTLVNAITISDGKTLVTTRTFSISGIFTGGGVAAIWDNRGTINFRSATAPMVVGQLQCNAAANTFKYNRTGNQDVTGGTYRIIEFGGSGVKKLLANVVVNTTAGGSWSITGTATIDYNGFTITTI